MEERTDSPTAVKVEEHSQYVIFTYFHGDTNSMVDAHFSRALSRSCKAKAPKKPRKCIKSEESGSCESRSTDSYLESQQPPPVAGHVLAFNCADGPQASWHAFTARTTENTTVPSITYSLSQEGLSLTGQQYASSLLNLLHSDRGEMGTGMASCSKPELLPGWTMPQGLRESVDSPANYEPGRRMEKKDLYWY